MYNYLLVVYIKITREFCIYILPLKSEIPSNVAFPVQISFSAKGTDVAELYIV